MSRISDAAVAARPLQERYLAAHDQAMVDRSAAQLLAERSELRAVTQRLIQEYAGRHPAGSIIRQVKLAHRRLHVDGVHYGMGPAAEAMVRSLLAGPTA